MTNHDKLAEITGENEPVDVEAVKMLLCRIYDDVEAGIFKDNYDKYLKLYKAQVEWLNSEIS